jgi:hypothetical protein
MLRVLVSIDQPGNAVFGAQRPNGLRPGSTGNSCLPLLSCHHHVLPRLWLFLGLPLLCKRRATTPERKLVSLHAIYTPVSSDSVHIEPSSVPPCCLTRFSRPDVLPKFGSLWDIYVLGSSTSPPPLPPEPPPPASPPPPPSPPALPLLACDSSSLLSSAAKDRWFSHTESARGEAPQKLADCSSWCATHADVDCGVRAAMLSGEQVKRVNIALRRVSPHTCGLSYSKLSSQR